MRKAITATILLISALLVTCFFLLPAAAQKSLSVPPQGNLATAEPMVREILPLMATDAGGKVSKQAYMQFMEAEFDRLDTAKSGQLDVSVLSRVTARPAFLGK